MAGAVRMRVRLRLDLGRRGPRDDLERGLYEGEEPAPGTWEPAGLPPHDAHVVKHGHVLADREHLLLQDQVRAWGQDVVVTSTLLLEGSVLGGLDQPLRAAGPPGKALARGADLMVKQAHEVADIFAEPEGRRAFARALREPGSMSAKQQRSLLFLVLLSALWVWAVGLAAIALLAPGAFDAWNLFFSVFGAALATNFFVPIPVEPVALAAVGFVGVAAATFAAAAGKAVGAWVIFTLGPWLRRAVARLEERSALTRRFTARAQPFAKRYGSVALGAMLAVPFSPFDIVPVYLFSSLGVRLGPFLAAVFLGYAVRLAIVLVVGRALLGL